MARQALISLQKGNMSILMSFCNHTGCLPLLRGALYGSKVLIALLNPSRVTFFLAVAQSHPLALGTGEERREFFHLPLFEGQTEKIQMSHAKKKKKIKVNRKLLKVTHSQNSYGMSICLNWISRLLKIQFDVLKNTYLWNKMSIRERYDFLYKKIWNVSFYVKKFLGM